MMEATASADEGAATTATQQQFLQMHPSSATATASASTLLPQQYTRYYGLIKREPQDFEVREIDLQGRVADITRPATLLAPPQQQHQQQASDPEPPQPRAAPMVDAPIPPLEELLAPEHVAALTALQARVEAAVAEDAIEESTEAGLLAACIELPLPEDKEARGRLHRAVRARCPCLQTSQEQAMAVAGQPPPGPLHLVARAGLGVHRQMRRLLPDPKQSLALYAFVGRGRADAGAPAGVVLGPLSSKNSRKALYSLVSDTFPQLKMTTVQQKGEGPTMLAQWKEQEPGRGSKKRKRGQDAPAAAPSVHRFVLRKEDTEHLDALRRLGMGLRVPLKRLAYAGAKDRRAVTFQFITAQNLSPDRVARLADLRIPGPAHKPALQLGDLEAGWPRPLQLGNNQGNAFRIRVRGVRPATATSSSSTATTITTTTTTDDEAASWRAELEGRLGQMKARGFVNYFGSQRLSPHRGWGPDAWEVGRAMLRRDWEAVTRLLLGPREWDSEKLKKAKAEFWGGNLSPKQLHNHFPHSLHREKLFLKGLAVHGQHNVKKALLFIPHHNRTQWANAYQSYLWNRAASEHMRLYGCRAVEGDLVLLLPQAPVKGEGASNKEKLRARALTQAEVEGAKGKELLYEVMLPLPGPGVEMPGGGVGELYKQMLEADGLWDLLRHGKEKDGLEEIDPVVTVTGAYRKLLARPQGLEWTIAGGPSATKAPELTLDLSFSLGSGEYATTAVGEVLGGEPESYLPPFIQPRESEPGVADGGGAEEEGLKASEAGDEGSGDERGGELDGKEGLVDV